MKNQINVQHIKNYFSKPSVLVLIIATAIPIFLSSILSIATLSELNYLLTSFSSLIINESSQDIFSGLSTSANSITSIISTITSLIISLIPIGVWVWIYVSSKSKEINKTPDTPLLINFIFSIFGIVSSCLSILICGFATIIFLPMLMLDIPAVTQEEQELMSFCLIFLIVLFSVLIILSIIQLFYYIGKTTFFYSARKCMKSDRIKPSGKLYGIFAICAALIYLLTSVSIIIFSIVLFSSDGSINVNAEFSSRDIISTLSIFDGVSVLILFTGILVALSAVPLFVEGKIALGYCKMAKTVPPTPEYNNYNNNNYYNNYNNNPNYQNNNYNQYNSNYNPNFNNQNFNQVNMNQQFTPQQPPVETSDYNDDFDNLNFNPYENK